MASLGQRGPGWVLPVNPHITYPVADLAVYVYVCQMSSPAIGWWRKALCSCCWAPSDSSTKTPRAQDQFSHRNHNKLTGPGMLTTQRNTTSSIFWYSTDCNSQFTKGRALKTPAPFSHSEYETDDMRAITIRLSCPLFSFPFLPPSSPPPLPLLPSLLHISFYAFISFSFYKPQSQHLFCAHEQCVSGFDIRVPMLNTETKII